MFDIDGTLVQTYDSDDDCYVTAVNEVTGLSINNDWSTYPYVTDRGILMTFIERQAPHFQIESLEPQVKTVFTRKISEHINTSPTQEIAGAKAFLEYLMRDDNFVVSLATGGWRETALLKLNSAGFDTSEVILSTSNDHHSRPEIMKLSAGKIGAPIYTPITYFGDAEWDVRACQDLNINLVIIGNRAEHSQRLPDFTNFEKLADYIANAAS